MESSPVTGPTLGTRIGAALGMGAGIAAQGFNLVFRHVEGWAPDWLVKPSMAESDLIVLQGPDQKRGAALVNRLAGIQAPTPVDYDALRPQRPLLARTQLTVTNAHDVHELTAQLQVAPDVRWSSPTRGAGRVAVYVDGRYHSDLIGMSERDAPYRINLAGLALGRHDIELRAADTDAASRPRVSVPATSTRRLDGDEALIARHAPILETRVPSRTGSGEPLDTDLPMLLAPTVLRRPDGSIQIDYDLLLSNEDGGIVITQAYSMLGRSIDQETVYRVQLDAAGNCIGDLFQGPLHVPYRFRGERVGDRPVLRVATANNLFTSQLTNATPRWSELPIEPTPVRRSDRELLIAHPWTAAVMTAETQREGKMSDGATKPGTVDDARRYLFLGPVGDALRGAYERDKGLELLLRDGSSVRIDHAFRIPFRVPFQAPMGTAVHLPGGIDGDAVAGVRALRPAPPSDPNVPSTTFVLDAAYRPRQLLLG